MEGEVQLTLNPGPAAPWMVVWGDQCTGWILMIPEWRHIDGSVIMDSTGMTEMIRHVNGATVLTVSIWETEQTYDHSGDGGYVGSELILQVSGEQFW
jgi:hypothetical protein